MIPNRDDDLTADPRQRRGAGKVVPSDLARRAERGERARRLCRTRLAQAVSTRHRRRPPYSAGVGAASRARRRGSESARCRGGSFSTRMILFRWAGVGGAAVFDTGGYAMRVNSTSTKSTGVQVCEAEMRYPPDHKAKSRAALLRAGMRSMKVNGFNGVGV